MGFDGIILQSGKGCEFFLSAKGSRLSGLLSNINWCDFDCDFRAMVPLPNIDGVVLKEIILFCEAYVSKKGHSSSSSSAVAGNEFQEFLCQFDQRMKNEKELLKGVILGSNYLDIVPLFTHAIDLFSVWFLLDNSDESIPRVILDRMISLIPKRWSPETHKHFPLRVRVRVETMASLAFLKKSEIFGMVPEEVRQLIYQFLADFEMLALKSE